MGVKAVSLLLAIVLFFSAMASGCWNLREPELLAIVLVLAFDYDEERDLYHVIAQVANPLVMGGEGQGGTAGEQRAFWVLSKYGQTPHDAVRSMQQGSSRELFFAHMQVILFSEAMARRGIREVMDLIERTRQSRLNSRPAVVQGDIRKLMEAEFPLEETGAAGLARQMDTIQNNESIFHNKSFVELFSAYTAAGQEMFIGKIKVLEEKGDEDEGGGGDGGGQEAGGGSPGAPPPASIGGGAIFKGDRMVGWANEHQTEGWLYVWERGRRFNFAAQCPDHEGSYFSVEIFKSSSSMLPVGEGKDVRIQIKLDITARLGDFGCEHDLDRDNEYIRRLERVSSQVIRNRIESMISRSQELGADVLGFGNLIYRKKPKLWRELEPQWDELFPEIPADIEILFNIQRPGMNIDPLPKQ